MQRRALIQNAALAALMSARGGLARGATPDADGHSVTRRAVSQRVAYPAYQFSDGSTRWITTSRRHMVPDAASDLQLVFGNVGQGPQGDETAGPNPIAITVELEYPHGVIHQILFRGQRTVTIEGGALITSDPLNLTIPDGAEFQVLTNVAPTAPPYKWPRNATIFAELGDWVELGAGENRMFAPPGMPHWHEFWGYGPFDILGRTAGPHVCVAIVGDSVVGHERSYIARALGTRMPWFNCSLGGDSLVKFLGACKVRTALLNGPFTHAICALGIADIRAGSDDAIVRQHFTQMWELLSGLGMKVIQTTITPDTTSTDHWASEAGQKQRSPNFLPGGLYQRINEWIRSVPPPLVACFDASGVLDSSVDSGLWTTSHGGPVTSDGPHPNEWGAEIGATCVDLSKLRL